MQTFFIKYNTGEYDSYYEHIYSIDAESKQDLMDEITKATKAYVHYKEVYDEQRNKVDELYRPKNPKTVGKNSMALYHEKLNEFYDRYDYPVALVVYGLSISPFDDLNKERVDSAISLANLTIHTVEEFIECCRPERSSID